MTEKKKIFMIADHPMAPSGVGTQTKYIAEALLATGRYKVVNLGGAIKHHDYTPQKVEGFDGDWIVVAEPMYWSSSLTQIFAVL